MLLIRYVMDSLFLVTPKSMRVYMHAWRHMLFARWFVDALLPGMHFFPASALVCVSVFLFAGFFSRCAL